jgi:hypothetical protein
MVPVMRPLARSLALGSALLCSAPLVAEQLVVSDLKAFSARIEGAGTRCEVDAVLERIAELAVISGTGYNQGQMLQLRANKTQYRALLTRACEMRIDYHQERANEKITIDGDQATIAADVTETFTMSGQELTAKSRQRMTVELFGEKLMVTQIVSNELL